MKKITLLLLLLTITFTSYAQLNEGFDTSALPTGWTVSNGGWDSGAAASELAAKHSYNGNTMPSRHCSKV